MRERLRVAAETLMAQDESYTALSVERLVRRSKTLSTRRSRLAI